LKQERQVDIAERAMKVDPLSSTFKSYLEQQKQKLNGLKSEFEQIKNQVEGKPEI
jgi:F0F1-type ATP synthase membrane subunit b/b'